MKKADVVLNGIYMVKVSGQVVPVKLVSERQFGGWTGVNQFTGRSVRIKTAAKLRRPWIIHQLYWLGNPLQKSCLSEKPTPFTMQSEDS